MCEIVAANRETNANRCIIHLAQLRVAEDAVVAGKEVCISVARVVSMRRKERKSRTLSIKYDNAPRGINVICVSHVRLADWLAGWLSCVAQARLVLCACTAER